MISFLLPTRGRLTRLNNFINSVLNTADYPEGVEFIVYIDEDDRSYDGWIAPKQVKIVRGPRKPLSQCYEWEKATGPIYAMGGDDVVFHTKGWDTKVCEAFLQYKDRIALVFGNDGDPNHSNYGTMPFIHKNWISVLGRFVPSYFTGDFTDTWLNELADMVGRKHHIDIYTEHIHPAFGKREQDQTDKDKWDKHVSGDMPKVYLDTSMERIEDGKKLKNFIDTYK